MFNLADYEPVEVRLEKFIKDILFASRNLIYDVTASVFVNLLVAAKVKSLKRFLLRQKPSNPLL